MIKLKEQGMLKVKASGARHGESQSLRSKACWKSKPQEQGMLTVKASASCVKQLAKL